MSPYTFARGLLGAAAVCCAAGSLRAQATQACGVGAFRTCNSVQITVRPLSNVPFATFVLSSRNHPGFGGPFVADTSSAVVDLSPRQVDIVADAFILSGYAVARARQFDLPHLMASLRGGRGGGGGRRR